LFCPKCSKATKQHLDKKWFVMYGHCFDCQVDFEQQLRKEGKLEEFEKQIINQHLVGKKNRRLFIWSLLNFESWINIYE
jgi:hypothetical protein